MSDCYKIKSLLITENVDPNLQNIQKNLHQICRFFSFSSISKPADTLSSGNNIPKLLRYSNVPFPAGPTEWNIAPYLERNGSSLDALIEMETNKVVVGSLDHVALLQIFEDLNLLERSG